MQYVYNLKYESNFFQLQFKSIHQVTNCKDFKTLLANWKITLMTS